jgi:ABC-type spermidine/putrescine transport system permease subunit I
MSRLRSQLSGLLLASPALLLLGALLLGPVLLLLRVSLCEEPAGAGFYRAGTWTLEGYRFALADAYTREVLLFTVGLGFAVTAVVLLAGYPLALFIHGLGPRARAAALAAVVLPKLANMLVVLYGLQLLLGSAGPVNGVLLFLGVVHQPVMLYRNLTGVIIGESYLILPYAVLVLVASLARIDPELALAARGLGAGPWQVLRRVTWPLSRPGLLLAGQLSLIWALGALLGPMLMGGPQETTLAVEVQRQAFERGNWPRGAVAAVVMTATLLVCLALVLVPLRRRDTQEGDRP